MPAPLKDARQILRAPDAAGIEAKWARHLSRSGITPWDHDEPVTAYVNRGRWVASCVECGGGMACWSEMDHTQCLDCGARYRVDFPEDADEAARILVERTIEHRNWFPVDITVGGMEHKGETVADLKAENALHGVRF